MNEEYLNSKKIELSILQIFTLKNYGFTISEVLFVIVCLSMLDGANCLITTARSLAEFLGISERHVYRTLGKLKAYGVEKINKRYDFTKLKESLDNLG